MRHGGTRDRYLEGTSSSTPDEIGGTRSKALEADVVGTWATCACAGGPIDGIVPCIGESLPPPPPPPSLASALSTPPSPRFKVAGVCELNRGAELLTGVVLLSGACSVRNTAARTYFGETACLTGSPRRLKVTSSPSSLLRVLQLIPPLLSTLRPKLTPPLALLLDFTRTGEPGNPVPAALWGETGGGRTWVTFMRKRRQAHVAGQPYRFPLESPPACARRAHRGSWRRWGRTCHQSCDTGRRSSYSSRRDVGDEPDGRRYQRCDTLIEVVGGAGAAHVRAAAVAAAAAAVAAAARAAGRETVPAGPCPGASVVPS